MSSGIEVIGNVRWKVILCLAVAWFLTFLALGKGVKSTGKVSLNICYFQSFCYLTP
jgi:hypothetical protein